MGWYFVVVLQFATFLGFLDVLSLRLGQMGQECSKGSIFAHFKSITIPWSTQGVVF